MPKIKLDNRGFSHHFLFVIVVLLFAIGGTYSLVASHAATKCDTSIAAKCVNHFQPVSNGYASSQAPQCQRVHGQFATVGNHMVDGQGRIFRTYGITVFGLSEPDWQARIAGDHQQIQKIADFWCANTVRLQVSPDSLFSHQTPGKAYNASYVQALDGEVNAAFRLGLNVVLSAQTENTHGSLNPTMQTQYFWTVLGRHYSNVNNMIFDLFNEPRVDTGNTEQTWSLWQKGGSYQGRNYIGMQTLVDNLRSRGIGRLFWVEGPYYGNTLNLVPTHLLKGGGLVYDIHHPNGPHTTANWDRTFVSLSKFLPVVAGEWAQYSSPASECWSDAPVTSTRFLNYLRSNSIGLITWTLKPGVLVRSASLTEPTSISANYSCASAQNQGSGNLILNYFRANNKY